MTAKRPSKKASSPPPSRPSKKKLLMNRERILAQFESGAFKGGSSARRDLFMRTKKGEPTKAFILPDLKPRGQHGDLLPYARVAAHWITATRDDGQEYSVGITCLEDLFDQEPYIIQRLIEAKVDPFSTLKKYELGMVAQRAGLECVPCRVIQTFGEDTLPKDTFGKRARLLPQLAFLVQAVNEERELKILPLKQTAIRAFMNAVFDPDILDPGQFEETGVMAKIELFDKAYNVTLLPKQDCPLPDWREKLFDLELMGYNFTPHDEQVQHMYTNLPGSFSNELAQIFQGVEAPVVKRPSGPPSKPSRVRSAR